MNFAINRLSKTECILSLGTHFRIWGVGYGGARIGALKEKLEKLKARVRAKVEHALRVIKCQFGYRKTRYRGLVKNTAQLITLFALSNLWMVRKRILFANG